MAVPLEKLEGKYEILRKLSEGGMGAIYRVRHRLLGDERVVKIMRPALEKDPSLRLRFEREARTASRLSHPNIAQLYDFTIDDEGFAFIVMEYIHGMNLEELIARQATLPVSLALEIAQQGLSAIGHLHVHGMIHRDVSPDNLMLSRDFEGRPLVKLIDLGIAKSLEKSEVGLTATGMFVGKLRYASPEQFHETGTGVSEQSDLYSFGLVLYELLTGCYPIVGDGPTSIIAGHLFRPPRDFAETDPEGRIPARLRQAVVRSLAKRPGERFPSAEEMAAALAELRRPGDLDDPEVDAALARTRDERRGEQPERGTTQKRLDRYFTTSHPTPVPRTEPIVRPADVDPRLDAVRRLVDTDRLAEARQALDEARREAGSQGTADPRLADLADRIHDRARTLHRARVRQLVTEAREARDRSDPECAVELLRAGLELIPGDRQLVELLEDAQRAVREKAVEEAAAKRRAEVDRLLREAEDLQRRDRLADAATVLGRALEMRPDDPDLLWRQAQVIGELEKRDTSSHVDHLVNRAQALSRAEDFTAAQRVVRQAVDLVPDHAAALELSRSLDTLRTLEAQECDTLERRLAEIRELLAAGQAGEAMKRLNGAQAFFGDHPDLQALRFEAAEAMLDMSIAEMQSARIPAETEAGPLADAATLVATPASGVAELTLASHLPDPSPLATDPPPAPSSDPPSTVSAADLGFGGFEDDAPPGQPLMPDETQVPDAGIDFASPKVWAVTIVLVLLFMLLGMWLAGQGEPTPPPDKPPVETEDVSGPDF